MKKKIRRTFAEKWIESYNLIYGRSCDPAQLLCQHLAEDEGGVTKIILTIIGILLHVVKIIGMMLEPRTGVSIKGRAARFAASMRPPRFANYPPTAWAAP